MRISDWSSDVCSSDLVLIFGVGQIDDLREVSPPSKIAGTVLAGSVLSIAGVSILYFRIPFVGLIDLSPDLSALHTVLWVIGLSTAINYVEIGRAACRERGCQYV